MSAELHHDPAYFRSMYDGDPDPWGFDRDWYERRKQALTLAALPRERYERAYEPGCANGAISELLAPRCDRLVATDLLDDVAERARARLAHLPHVLVERAAFPGDWPDGSGDLVVLSEVAYYLTDEGLAIAGDRLEGWLRPGGDVVAVHYTEETNYPRTGADVGRWLDGLAFLDRLVTHVDERFELGVWRRT